MLMINCLLCMQVLFAQEENPNKVRKNEFGINAGFTTGVGFSYRCWPKKLGFQLTALPIKQNDKIWISAGITGLFRGSILQSRRNVLELERDLIFYSRKTKIFKEDVYHRNLMFKFLKGDRVLFFGGRRSGKSSLARTFAGLSAFNSKSLKVKIDGRRLDYSSWQKIGRGTYFFDFDFRSQGSLMEFILGRDKTDISQDDIALVLRICSDNKELADLVSASGNFNQAADTALSNPLAAFALQALHCLVNKPAFIIVDNPWLDLNYPEINGIIKTLDCALPGSILLLFSNSNNKILDYNNIYALDKKIEKIK